MSSPHVRFNVLPSCVNWHQSVFLPAYSVVPHRSRGGYPTVPPRHHGPSADGQSRCGSGLVLWLGVGVGPAEWPVAAVKKDENGTAVMSIIANPNCLATLTNPQATRVSITHVAPYA